MRWIYVGNFGPAHSTESHVAQALEGLGHEVVRVQEDDPGNWRDLAEREPWWLTVDAVLWTRTGWDWMARGITREDALDLQLRFLERARAHHVPTVGYHLDRWWGLNREGQVYEEPFFRVALLITADGGHDAEWAQAGVNHLWMPPGVSEFECIPGVFDQRWASDLAFVGSWQGHYHEEWTHRAELVAWLKRAYPRRCVFYPQRGQPAVRGEDLRKLYASVKVLVGDSCLYGDAYNYWSDRIPETLGRGGFLVHPDVKGLELHYSPGEHLVTWPVGDWGMLRHKIDWALEHEQERREIAEAGRAHVLAHHTYTVRLREVCRMVTEGEVRWQ